MSSSDLPSDFEFIDEKTERENTDISPSSLFHWVLDSSSDLLSRLAETTKNSMDSVITILDPQMKETLSSELEVIVASDKEYIVDSIRTAFSHVFPLSRVTLYGLATESKTSPETPIGFSAALLAAEERISQINKEGVLGISVVNFLFDTGDEWINLDLLLLKDFNKNIRHVVYGQSTRVESSWVKTAQERTPKDYFKNGISLDIGSVIGENLGVSPLDWAKIVNGGTSRTDILNFAAKSLVQNYKKKFNADLLDS